MTQQKKNTKNQASARINAMDVGDKYLKTWDHSAITITERVKFFALHQPQMAHWYEAHTMVSEKMLASVKTGIAMQQNWWDLCTGHFNPVMASDRLIRPWYRASKANAERLIDNETE